MIRRRLISALPLLLLAAPAAARAEGAAKKDPGQVVDLLPVGMPIVVGGELVNYVFVTVRLLLTPSADAMRWRAKEPYFRDALVRIGHETPFVLPSDYDKIDTAKLCAALLRQAQAIAGPGVVRGVVVLSQTPSHRARTPHA
jgi:hypothetical protein